MSNKEDVHKPYKVNMFTLVYCCIDLVNGNHYLKHSGVCQMIYYWLMNQYINQCGVRSFL